MGWIGVDLDGTLAEYDVWRGIAHIGKPLEPMVERVKGWLAEGKEVRIFTARAAEGPEAVAHIHAWLERAGLPALPVTNMKDLALKELWDDRAVRVVENMGIPWETCWCKR